MRKFRVFVSLLLLITVPSLPLYSEYTFSKMLFPRNDPITPLSYDDFLNLFEQIESGELEKKCTPEEIEEVSQFLAFLLRVGALPDGSEEELEQDIEELLGGEEESFGDLLSFAYLGEHQHLLIPAAVYKITTLVPCKSDFAKNISKFVNKHKKELIIAAIIVVAVTATVVGVVYFSAAAGAIAAGAAGASSASGPDIDGQVTSLKEALVKEDLLPSEAPALEERGRAVGSAFVHNTLNQSAELDIPRHFWADQQFNTNCPHFYNVQAKEGDLAALAHQALGENALAHGRYQEAVHELDKAIALEPTNPTVHLDRGLAHLGLNEFEQALEDYYEYRLEVSPQSFPVEEFAIGLVKELPNALYHSGKNLATFVSDLACHPIQTGSEMIQAIGQLSELARNGEWGTIAEITVPEAVQLVKEWPDLSIDEQAKRAGAIFGQCGSDILIPGTLVKAASRGAKVAEELAVVSKRLQTAKKTLVLETVVAAEEGAKIAEILQLESRISEWLGEGTKLIRNEAGDHVFLSKDGLRCVRFDFHHTHPHNNPHAHTEIKINGKWMKSGPIYPTDVPHN